MKTLIILASVYFFFITSGSMYSQPYRYPELPGDKLWKHQKTYADKVKLCNIPDHILKKMPTPDLIESVFQFPFIQNLLLQDNFLEGFENMRSIFNGLDELLKRKDVPNHLFNEYIDKEKRNVISKSILLEYFLSLPEIQMNLDKVQKKELLNKCLENYQFRSKRRGLIFSKSLISVSYCMIRILSFLDAGSYYQIVQKNENIKKFSDSSVFGDYIIIRDIASHIISSINEIGGQDEK